MQFIWKNLEQDGTGWNDLETHFCYHFCYRLSDFCYQMKSFMLAIIKNRSNFPPFLPKISI